MKKILIPSPYKYKKLIGVLALTAMLAGCATITSLQQAITSTVTPTEAIVAANSFDAIEAGATGYLTYCKSTPADVNCSAANRRSVIAYTRSGRAARNQVETYVQSSTNVPSAIYNTLVTAVNNLKSTPAASYSGSK